MKPCKNCDVYGCPFMSYLQMPSNLLTFCKVDGQFCKGIYDTNCYLYALNRFVETKEKEIK